MTPVFSLGSLSVTPFALTVLAGALAGVLLTLRKKQFAPVLPFVLAGALLLGHMWWVFFCPPAYTADSGILSRLLRIWDGGYTLYGALTGGLLGAILGSKCFRLNIIDTLDALAPGACAALIFCRLGEYFIMQGFGDPVDDEALHFFPVSFCTYADDYFEEWCYAIWAWEALAALVILIFLLARARKAKPGEQAILFVTALGSSQILLEQMRRDDFVRLNPFVRFSQIAALLSLIGILVILFVRRRPGKKKIIASCAELVFASLAIVFAEFVFEKPQFTAALYISLGLTAVGFVALLLVFRGKSGLPASCALAAAAAALLVFHILDHSWELDLWLLYGMMAVSVIVLGTIVFLNASRRPKPVKA